MSLDRTTMSAVVLAIGIAIAGLLAGNGLARARSADRFVTVKGISEREVQADLAIWPLQIIAADENLAGAHAQLQNSLTKVREFLERQQVDLSTSVLQDFSVTDALMNQYGPPQRVGPRYLIRQTMVVRSTRPELILAANQKLPELLNAGVVLSSGDFGYGGPTFIFTRLNELKPDMIREATARAREAAEQFARDSDSSVGAIRQANQGVFEILPRDQAQGINAASQIDKTVRVVSTIEYLLGN